MEYAEYSGTSPLRHLYSKDTSIQGTQNLVLEKRLINLGFWGTAHLPLP